MCVHIAIPEPTTSDSSYNQHSLPPYLAALRAAGAQPVIVPLHERHERVARLLKTVQGILLPGSPFDVDPQIYGAQRSSACGPSDAERTAIDELMLQEAFSLQKPILAICGGAQSLNVWRNGSLVQDLHTAINHRAGNEVTAAHAVQITPGTRLSRVAPEPVGAGLMVNSTHHQAMERIGDQLRVAAVSPMDGVIEAVELDSAEHFVLGVQWHPERTFTTDAFSRAIFALFVQAATVWTPRPIGESVVMA